MSDHYYDEVDEINHHMDQIMLAVVKNRLMRLDSAEIDVLGRHYRRPKWWFRLDKESRAEDLCEYVIVEGIF